MKTNHKSASERFIKISAWVLIFFCFLSIYGYIMSVVLCLDGKEVYVVHTKDEAPIAAPVYEQEGIRVRFLTAGPSWDINVWTDENNQVDKPIYDGLILMFVLYAAVGISAEICLILIFRNLRRGRTFVQKNSSYLFIYGLLQLVDVFALPLICRIIAKVVNGFSQGKVIFEDIGPGIINKLVPCIVYLVAVYIIRYGFKLQDEVDHTL